MPEETIDGSHLEQNLAGEATTIEPLQVETPVEQVEPTQPQSPQSNIPEQFKDYTPDQWFNEWNRLNSMNGRYKTEVSNLRQQHTYAQTNQGYNQQPQPSLPGQEAYGQRQGQPQVNLNEVYWEKPADAIAQIVEPIVEKRVNAGIQSFQQQEAQRQQQAVMGRAQWISAVDEDELQNLRLDENVSFTPEHEALMESLAKRNPEIISKLQSPQLTEQEIRKTMRDLYAKADGILKGQLQDPERLKAFTQAQKQAASNGAPTTRASTTNNQGSGEVPANWKFLFDNR